MNRRFGALITAFLWLPLIGGLARTADATTVNVARLDARLTPGSYLLICNVPGHYAAGMVTPLTVTP